MVMPLVYVYVGRGASAGTRQVERPSRVPRSQVPGIGQEARDDTDMYGRDLHMSPPSHAKNQYCRFRNPSQANAVSRVTTSRLDGFR